MSAVTISIIICTRNRAESLRKTLESIGRCKADSAAPAELIVVDNGSTDATADVVRSTTLTNVSVRYLFEPRAGKCFGLNRALRDSTGSVIVFTDDDVRFPEDWLTAISAPILEKRLDFVSGMVRIAPQLEREWLVGGLRAMFAVTDGDPRTAPVNVGANLAFARKVLMAIPAFDEELGPGQMGGGDDVLFHLQMCHAGFRHSQLTTGGEVEHDFDPQRLTRKSILKMCEAYGRGAAYIQHHWEHGRPKIPWLRAKAILIRLALLRAIRRPARQADRCYEWETALVLKMSSLNGASKLRRLRRNYSKYGLVKLHNSSEGT